MATHSATHSSAINFGMGGQNGYGHQMGSQQSLNMYGQQQAAQQQQHFNRQNYEFHQMPQQQQEQLAQQQRRNQLRGCGTGSVTSIHSLQNGKSHCL